LTLEDWTFNCLKDYKKIRDLLKTTTIK